MASTMLEQVVKQAVTEWMEKRSGLLQNVCQEVADEIGPLIGRDVARGLAEALTPTDKDRQIVKLQAACLHVAEWFQRVMPQMPANILRSARSMEHTLNDAVGPDIPFNIPAVELDDQADADVHQVDEIEGGGA